MAIVLIERMMPTAFVTVRNVFGLLRTVKIDDHDQDRDQQAADAHAGRQGPAGPPIGGAGPRRARRLRASRCARSSRLPTPRALSRRTQIGPADAGRPVREGSARRLAQPPEMAMKSLRACSTFSVVIGLSVLVFGRTLPFFEQLGTGEGAEPGLVAPLLVERHDLRAGLDGIELADAHVPAKGEDLARVVRSRRWPARRARRRCRRSR